MKTLDKFHKLAAKALDNLKSSNSFISHAHYGLNFKKPNWTQGYGSILWELNQKMVRSKHGKTEVPMETSAQLFDVVDGHPMTHSLSLIRLLAAKLIERPLPNCYRITKFGEKYAEAWDACMKEGIMQ